MLKLKQSTVRNIMIKVFLASDHITAATGKTLTVTASKDGGAFAAIGGTVTEVSSGWYKIALTTTDTNTLGTFIIRATATGCDDAEHPPIEVVAYDATDSAALGLSRVDAAISSRSTYAGGAVASVTGNVGGNVVGSVASVTAGVTVSTNNDKTGYGLSATAVQAIWDALTSALTTVGSVGKMLVTNLDAAVSSRSTYAGGDTAGTTTLLSRIASAITITGGKVDVNDKTGFSLGAAYDAAKTAASATDVRTQVDGALDAAGTELSAVPGTTGTLREKLGWLFEYFRNRKTVTATAETLYKEDAATVLGTATVSDDGTTFDKGEMN